MDYKEKYMILVEQIKMESEWAHERRELEKDKPKLNRFNTGSCFAYESIMSTIDVLEEQ